MLISNYSQGSLRVNLTYDPKDLQFGTSGRRGNVKDLSHLEIFINVVSELKFLQSIEKINGGIIPGDDLFFAYDLRPSSNQYVAEQGNRGKLVQIVAEAIRHVGMIPRNCGQIPTPALTYYALLQGKASIMVTGSHIPFERNGYKLNTSRGELLKQHEQPINDTVKQIRTKFYSQSVAESLFTTEGFLKSEPNSLDEVSPKAQQAYIQRYLDFFPLKALSGLRILVYQHSAVGRDLIVEILQQLGAFVATTGRSDTFVPIDTENMHGDQIATIQALYNAAAKQHGAFDAIVSTDGDSDRPLLLGIDPTTTTVRFFGGDLVGMITAQFLQPDAIVVPISSNDSIDYSDLKHLVENKTRIGSPYVIAGMEKALAQGKQKVCGWEANGGFLTGSDFISNGKRLGALPTRDAILPILAVLNCAQKEKIALTDLFARLPQRYSCAALLKQFPRDLALNIVHYFSPQDNTIQDVNFTEITLQALAEQNVTLTLSADEIENLHTIRKTLSQFFHAIHGFSEIIRINYTDGIRIYFANQDIAHLRPSGNADELRIYAVANSQQRADAIANRAIQEPDGILRCIESHVKAL